MDTLTKAFVFCGLLLISLTFQNCTELGFSDFSTKQETLEENIFPDPGDCSDNECSASSDDIPIRRFCTTEGMMNGQYEKALNATNVWIHIEESDSEQVLCHYRDDSFKSAIRTAGKNAPHFNISGSCLDKLEVNIEYDLQLMTSRNGQDYSLHLGYFNDNLLFTLNSDRTIHYENINGITVLFNYAEQQMEYPSGNDITSHITAEEWAYMDPADHCEDTHSPLIIDLRGSEERHEPIRLTSQLKGILFDILGLNSYPKAHTKKQISWTDSKRYAFLTLPNAQGQVEGINEMFGNNTLGPDHDFANNGYHALAKYDGRRATPMGPDYLPDGIINSKDPIYRRLRLWSDLNFNGKSEPNELRSLEEVGLVAIDLNYDDSFYEVDHYGNETRMRSVVKFKDGRYRLIFDLWFKLIH